MTATIPTPTVPGADSHGAAVPQTADEHHAVDPQITISRLSHSVGAKIEGLKLSGALPPDTVRWLRTQLAVHKVLIIRGQHDLDDEGQYAFASLLGTPTLAHPTVLSTGRDRLALEGAANAWHTDVSFVDRIPKISVLRAVNLPSYGGATQWANTVAAYQRLPEPLSDLADKLWATHTNDYDYASRGSKDNSGLAYDEFVKVRFETEHPLVHVHPQTGERALLLGQFVSRINGLRPRESAELLRIFQDRVINPDNTLRWHWEAGDVAIWDNLATQHYGVADFGNEHRLNHRVTLAGPVPVNVAGQRSRTISGDATEYSVIDDLEPLESYPGDIAGQ